MILIAWIRGAFPHGNVVSTMAAPARVWKSLDVRTVGVSFDQHRGWNNWESG
jgi:hypothetical protein